MELLLFISYLFALLIQLLILWASNNTKNPEIYDNKQIIVKYYDKLLWNFMLYIKLDIALIFLNIGILISSNLFNYSAKYIPVCLTLTVLMLLLIIYYYLLFRNKEIIIDEDNIRIKNMLGRKRVINFKHILKVKIKSSKKIKIKTTNNLKISINNKMSNFNRVQKILEKKNLIEKS